MGKYKFQYVELPNNLMAILFDCGLITFFDKESYNKVKYYNWYIHKSRNTFYAKAYIDNKNMGMHRLLLGIIDKDTFSDHKNGDGLDNRMCNLRPCTRSQNAANSKPKRKYRGVDKDKRSPDNSGWRAAIQINGRRVSVNCKSETEAAFIYNILAKKYHGEFARLNNINNFTPPPDVLSRMPANM
jgi:hypothetical protein